RRGPETPQRVRGTDPSEEGFQPRGPASPGCRPGGDLCSLINEREVMMVRVLLVEDNPENWDALSRRLQRRGYEVIIAADGKKGLGMAQTEAPDVILLDISLPEMDGWEVAQTLQASETTRNIPVIALTAHAMAGDRDKALAIGCEEYHTKPVQFPRLLAQI